MYLIENLRKLIEEKDKKDQWFDLSEIAISAENSFEEKTKNSTIVLFTYS